MADQTKRQSSMRFAGLLMIGALIGKLLGFVREILFARALGANLVADSFRGGMTAILMPIAPLQGDMVPSTLVPLHKEWFEDGRAVKMMSSLTFMFGIISSCIMVIVYVFAPIYVDLLLGGFTPEAKSITIRFVHVMSLAIPASVMLNCCACIELSNKITRLTAIRASIQNVSVIAGIAIMMWTHNPISIAWGFTLAMNLVTIYGFVMLWREKEIDPFSITLDAGLDALKTFLHRVKPLFAQPLFDQGNIILEKLLSSSLVIGSLASLDYARTLTDTMVYFISQPLGYVVLGQTPSIDIKQKVYSITQPILTLAMPASAFTFVFAEDIVTIVFRRGEFQEQAIELTTHAIQGISLGLWGATIGWILVRMLNASKRNKTAAKIFVVAYIGNMIMNLVSFHFFGVFGIGMGEATRGILLLAGTSYALGCSRIIARLIVQTAPLALIVAFAGLVVQHIYTVPLARLAAGSSAAGVIVIVWVLLFVPELVVAFKRKFIKPKAMLSL